MPPALSRPIVIVKIGTSSILRETGTIALATLAHIIETLCDLRASGYHVILVSSGAVGVGCQRLGVTARPTETSHLQALAAVGQVHLMRHYEDLFAALGQPIAQVLLTQDNLSNSSQFQNAENTFCTLLEMGVIPVVNENDSVSCMGVIKFGDNDTLSALVGILCRADWLFLMTDVDALYDKNPNDNSDPVPAKPFRVVSDFAELKEAASVGSQGSQWGTGGMMTKVKAAELACAAGVRTCIIKANQPNAILQMLQGSTDVGTQFVPQESKIVSDYKRWIMAMPLQGSLTLDAGAVRAIRKKNSLFAVGIIPGSSMGEFQRFDVVRLLDEDGNVVGRGVSNYSHEEVAQLCGSHSRKFESILGYCGPDELISRENLAYN